MPSAIAPIDFDDLAPELREALRARYERLGYLGDFFRHMAHQPAALRAFDAFTEACKQALEAGLAETVALTVATRTGNRYERHQHERLAVRLGRSPSWVASVELTHPECAGSELSAAERCVQRFVLAALDDLRRTDVDEESAAAARLDALVAEIGEGGAVAVAMLTARFVGHALISRACRLEPPVPSIFEDGFGG